MRRKASRTRKVTSTPSCPSSTFSRDDSSPSLYTITIRGDRPTRGRVFGHTFSKSQPFTNTARKTRVYTTTIDRNKALRLQKELEQKGERVVVTST